ncbi:MAG: hypothetical protein A3G24_06965 [Betaproteobacteria bacterium RIFCSPLOWO2_12_FULL_62_13]|nr:MAG: hypothetical protein A3G24_06965 [Betaproteobacteria bacterium RIFCSPLOWO2_12_FULL_62_13]
MANLPGTGGEQRLAEVEQLRAQLAAARAHVEKLTALLHEQEVFSQRVERASRAWTQTVDALAQPIFMHDETGCIVRANRAYAKRAGVPVKNLIGKVYWKLFPQQDAPFAVPADSSAFPSALIGPQQDDPFAGPPDSDQTEFEFSPSPGEVFLVRSVGASSGLPRSWRLYIFQDVTELKRAEAALRMSGQYARGIIDSSLAMIVAADRDRRIVEFNPAAQRTFGYQREEVLGKPMNMLYADPAAGDAVRRSVLERDGMVGEIVNRRKSGELFTSLLSAAILRDAEGKMLGVVGTSMDISERKQAQANMDAVLIELELIFENAVVGIAFAMDRVIQRVNRRFAEMLGYEKNELIGKSTEIVYPAREDYEKLGRDAYPELAQGRIYRTETRFRRKDGSLIWVHLAGRAADREKDGTKSIWVFEDITERKAAEEQLKRREAYFRALTENGNDVTVVVNAEGTTRYQSPAVERMLGHRAPERIGRSLFELVHPDEFAKVRDSYQRVLQGGSQRVKTEFRMRHRDGSWRLVEGIASGAFDLDGEMVGIVNLHDVTERRRSEQRLLHSMEGAITAIAAAAELRDAYGAGHQRGVAALSAAIAREMGLGVGQAHGLRLAGVVHDIGKIQTPAEILTKPSRLAEVEYALIKTHPQAGHDILKGIDLPWPIAEIVLQHHELLDGSGYPRGLKGDEILLEARILAVADVVEAMVSQRFHRPGLSIDAALAEITKFRGTKFDPGAVDACVRLFREKGFAFENR